MSRLTLVRHVESVVIAAATILLVLPVRAEMNAASTQAVEGASAVPFVAQAVGLAWLNPLQRRDYPTEWQLLWTLGLVKPNSNDDMVRTKPAKYTTLQPISIVADGSRGRESFSGFYEKYVNELLVLFAFAIS